MFWAEEFYTQEQVYNIPENGNIGRHLQHLKIILSIRVYTYMRREKKTTLVLVTEIASYSTNAECHILVIFSEYYTQDFFFF